MTAGTFFDVIVEADGGNTLLTLHGVLDVATSGALRTTLYELVRESAEDVVIDLRSLEYLDSTGLGVLVGAQKRALERDNQIRLVVAEGRIERLLRITGLTSAFAVYRTIDDAREDSRRIVSLID